MCHWNKITRKVQQLHLPRQARVCKVIKSKQLHWPKTKQEPLSKNFHIILKISNQTNEQPRVKEHSSQQLLFPSVAVLKHKKPWNKGLTNTKSSKIKREIYLEKVMHKLEVENEAKSGFKISKHDLQHNRFPICLGLKCIANVVKLSIKYIKFKLQTAWAYDVAPARIYIHGQFKTAKYFPFTVLLLLNWSWLYISNKPGIVISE